MPFDPAEKFGSRRAPLIVTVNGHRFASRVQMYGGVGHVTMRAEHREAAGVVAGTRVRASFEVDDAPRTVEVPTELARAMRRVSGAVAAFDSLSYSRQREWCDHVSSAVRPETRERRAVAAAPRIAAGERLS